MDPVRMHRAMQLEYLHGRMHDAAQLALQVVDMADEVSAIAAERGDAAFGASAAQASADARRLAARLDRLAWRADPWTTDGGGC